MNVPRNKLAKIRANNQNVVSPVAKSLWDKRQKGSCLKCGANVLTYTPCFQGAMNGLKALAYCIMCGTARPEKDLY